MANATYDNFWRDAMADLHEQLHVEGVDDEEMDAQALLKSTGPSNNNRDVTIFQAFQHFACLYIKYLQIFRKLESCYDCMIHPQKRLHVRNILELVIKRVIELKHDLVRWNPPNSYVRIPQGPEEPFPWEYVHLDDILVDLKLSPDTLEIPVPKYFREDQARRLQQRDQLVLGYMRLKHNRDDIFLMDHFDSSLPTESMTMDRAIEMIQRNERGRQGTERAMKARETREKERQGRMYDSASHIEMDQEIAATNLQRMFRGFHSRFAATSEREKELIFVGMRPREDKVDYLENELNVAYRKRKQEQAENKELYEKALEQLKDVIMDEEGSAKREELREERTLWITDQIAQKKFPEDLEEFNAVKNYVPPPEEGGEKKEEKKDKKKDEKKDKDKGKGKGKGKAAAEEEDPRAAMPKLQGRTELTEAMYKTVTEFEDVWEDKMANDHDNYQQRHDEDLAKKVIRPGVYEEIRKQVDSMLTMNLKKIKMQLDNSKAKKKGKKGKKKGKKGKKDKKRKPLPGEKISELKGLDADQMLSMLIEQQLVVRCRPHAVQDLIGDFNYLGSMHHVGAERKDDDSWTPQDPSMAQIRQSVIEYCILPNGSQEIKAGMNPKNDVKSVMLFGPSGSGKTLVAEIVASELGALLIHLSPEKLKGLFSGKNGPTKLVHMVMTVAKDPSMQPVVVYIDECEQFFAGGGKKSKGDKDGPSRFKKDFMVYKDDLVKNHTTARVIIIGTSKQPEGDTKDARKFFDRFLYLPYPDYSSRLMLWSAYLRKHVAEAYRKIIADSKVEHGRAFKTGITSDNVKSLVSEAVSTLDLSSLAHISEGYTAGAIVRTVRSIITVRRVMMLRAHPNERPLNNTDFIDNLSMQDVTYQDDKAIYLAFLRLVSGMDERRDKIKSILSGEAGDGNGKDDKKGKGKGKGKGKK